MQNKLLSIILNFIFVFLQFGGIVLIIITGPLFCNTPLLFIIQIAGFILGIWAILIMKIDNLSILPKLKTNARFVDKGPYKMIRHPMYLAILLTFGPLIVSYFSLPRMITFIIILLDLIFKSFYEETLLMKRFENYSEYSKKTYRIIPYIF